MNLSEAIRLGAMLRDKADGFFFMDGKTCAAGAALEACGSDIGIGADKHGAFRELWPWTITTYAACPQCGRSDSVRNHIPHLNNSIKGGHNRTREQIADWIEGIEKQQAQPQETPAETLASA